MNINNKTSIDMITARIPDRNPEVRIASYFINITLIGVFIISEFDHFLDRRKLNI